MNMTKTVSIIFYKGPGNFRDRLVRLWTKSPYSHSEFGRSDGLYHSNDRLDLVSKLKNLDINQKDWEVFELTLPSEIIRRVERRQLRKNGTTYDWTGIVFSQFFRLGWHDKTRWFCSKSNADDLHYAHTLMYRSHNKEFEPFLRVLEPITKFKPHQLSPHSLFEIVKMMEKTQQSAILKI
jgi:hypothetical protein